MTYMLLGRTGLRVSELALGSGTFGTAWGWGAERAECKAIFDAFAKAGGNFIDTASGYQDGEAERLIGEFIRSERAHFVVNTKYSGPPVKQPTVAIAGNGRKAMATSIEESLRSLCIDHVDLFMVHFADGMTPMEEIVRGFEDVLRAGKALYVGFSDFPAWRIARGVTLAELRDLPVAAIQIELSLAERTAERELLPMAEGLGLGVTLWSVLGSGLLSGKYGKPGARGRLSQAGGIHGEPGARKSRILDAVESVAAEIGATPAQVAVAWVRARAAAWKTSIIPILGARTRQQIDENLGALSIALTTEQCRKLDEASAIKLGFPQ
jgi:aryl-alcohol dehydrogenase-like predicted oxidoreductase